MRALAHLPLHTAPELCLQFLECSFTSTETVRTVRDGGKNGKGKWEPRPTSLFTQRGKESPDPPPCSHREGKRALTHLPVHTEREREPRPTSLFTQRGKESQGPPPCSHREGKRALAHLPVHTEREREPRPTSLFTQRGKESPGPPPCSHREGKRALAHLPVHRDSSWVLIAAIPPEGRIFKQPGQSSSGTL